MVSLRVHQICGVLAESRMFLDGARGREYFALITFLHEQANKTDSSVFNFGSTSIKKTAE